MNVKVIKNKVFDGVKTYEVGDVIVGLSEKDESQLISDGIVEYLYEQEMKKDIDNGSDKEGDLKGDIQTAPIDEVTPSEDEKISPESEENLSDLIDPNTFALNPDDYLKSSAPKSKKEKAV